MARFFKLLLLMTGTFVNGATAEVVIEDNGYSGIVVSIHENIPESPLLLDSIKNMITEASPRLYKSTKQRAYFKKVTIVVPSSWSPSPNYTMVPQDHYMSLAEVRIAPPHPSYGDIPYTLQLGGCGERGQYIHMTPAFLLDEESKTDELRNSRNSKIFLHEWAHFRYGVFNEYGERGNAKSPIFYKDENDKIRVNGCPETIKGWIRRSDGKSRCTVDINKNLVSDCTFYPDLKTKSNDGSERASLMYMPELKSADEFCDDQTPGIMHNPSAPNMQNRMCNTRSVLDVVLSNEDFQNNRNTPRSIDNITPEILTVQLGAKLSPKFVLVLDVSGSMNSDNRLKLLEEGTTRLLRDHIKDACNVSLGIVAFYNGSSVLANLTTVNDSTREQLIQKIPKSTKKGTDIGGGILKAIEVLRQGGVSTENAKLIILSDGEENKFPKIKDLNDQIKQAGVVIYTLAIGKQASVHLEELSNMTGGRADFFNSSTQVKSMDSILRTIILDSGCNDALPIVISNRTILVPKGDNFQGAFYVDDGIGSTIVFISYNRSINNEGKYPLAIITDPTNKIFDNQSYECTTDEDLGSIQFRIPVAEPGKWNYWIENPGSEDVRVNIKITSEMKNDVKDRLKDHPIHVRSWVSSVNLTYPETSKIFSEVTKGGLPVLKAQVEATGYRPDGKEEVVTLQDNGKGADLIANDGVYTEYFTRYNGDGRYQVDVNVRRTPETKLLNNASQMPKSQRTPVMRLLFPESVMEKPRDEFSFEELKIVNEPFESSAIYIGDTSVDSLNFGSMDTVKEFERYVFAGTINLKNWSPNDKIPPCRIWDLKIVRASITERTVQLEWTSTGGDMYYGKATTIEIRYHYNAVYLVRSFEHSFSDVTIVKGNLDPLSAYVVHNVIVQMPPEERFSVSKSIKIVYFAVRALDKEGNAGEVSNAVNVVVPLKPKGNALPLYAIVTIVGSIVIVVIMPAIAIGITCAELRRVYKPNTRWTAALLRRDKVAPLSGFDEEIGLKTLEEK